MSLVDVMFTREQVAAARTQLLEKTEAVRAARQHQHGMEVALRAATYESEDAKNETLRLEAELSALEAEAEKYGLTKSQVWNDLLRAEMEAKVEMRARSTPASRET